jgi:hypothetical protein
MDIATTLNRYMRLVDELERVANDQGHGRTDRRVFRQGSSQPSSTTSHGELMFFYHISVSQK